MAICRLTTLQGIKWWSLTRTKRIPWGEEIDGINMANQLERRRLKEKKNNSGGIVKGQRSGISLFSFLEFALHRQTEWSSLPCSGFCVKEGHYHNNKSLYCRFFSCSENVHGCDHYQHAYVYKQFQRQIYPLAIVGFNDVFTKRFLINNSAPHAHKISTSIA